MFRLHILLSPFILPPTFISLCSLFFVFDLVPKFVTSVSLHPRLVSKERAVFLPPEPKKSYFRGAN